MLLSLSNKQWTALGLATLLWSCAANAQVTKADYARAAGLMKKYRDLTENVADVPSWIEGEDVMVYSRTVPGGHQFILADAVTGSKKPAFDQEKLAAELNQAAHTDYKPMVLPFTRVQFVDHRSAVEFTAEQQRWRCDLQSYHCAHPTNPFGRGNRDDQNDGSSSPNSPDRTRPSPNKQWNALIENYNVVV